MKKNVNKNNKEIIRYYPKFNEGLTSEEVNSRINDNLINKEKVKTSKTYLSIIIKNVFTFFNILLITIGIILILSGNIASCAFLVILILNLTIGLFQDFKAKKALSKLNLLEKEKVTVIRNGIETKIYSDDIVLDDVFILTKGMKVPCDSIVLYKEAMLDESLLTGESLPQKKSIGDNILSGTYVISGTIYCRSDKVGKDNYISKIELRSKEYKEPKSKMFLKLNRLFKLLTIIVIIIGIFEIIEFMFYFFKGSEPQETYDFIIELIPRISGALISMIPSGMYLLTSTTLVVGVINLAKQNILIKDMYSQETLARIDYLCMDKTGTITDGNMSVFEYILLDKSISEDRFEAYLASYCAKLGEDNYTSLCLKEYFKSKNILEVTSYISFSSVYKYSAVTLKDIGTLAIGAHGFLKCDDLSDENENLLLDYENKGLRTLVVGLSKKEIKDNKLPDSFKILAIILIQDHIREEAKEAIEWFYNNNVNIKIISGDNPLTASLIAKRSGVKEADKFISLEGKSDEEVLECAKEYCVFGRVTPEQKELIIESLRKDKHTVAMVGDGINDCLALKRADVSIALDSGSKATKDITSFVLLNNDFSKLSNVVNEGRRVINNLERTCSLFLTKTIFSILMNLFFLSYAFYGEFTNTDSLWPFSPNNFYSWELITIGISAFLLALESNSKQIKGSFLSNILKKALPHGIMIALLIILIYSLHEVLSLNNESLLNIATLIMSICSFIPLFDVSKPINTYRALVFAFSLLLAASLLIWSTYGFNWLFINGRNSEAPRYLSNNEIIIISIATGVYLLLYLIYLLIKKLIKNGKIRRKN